LIPSSARGSFAIESLINDNGRGQCDRDPTNAGTAMALARWRDGARALACQHLTGNWRSAMRTIPITVAAFALLSAAVSAQTPQTSPSRDDSTRPSPSATAAPTKPAPAINPLTQENVSWIAGPTVYGSDDTKLGNISTVLMDPKTKQINRARHRSRRRPRNRQPLRRYPGRSVLVGRREGCLQAFEGSGQLESDARMGRRRDGDGQQPAARQQNDCTCRRRLGFLPFSLRPFALMRPPGWCEAMVGIGCPRGR